MHKRMIRVAAISASAFAVGCSLLGPDVPKCSDQATLDLARKIIAEDVGAVGENELRTEALRTLLPLEMPHATSLQENINKYSCAATLQIKAKQGPQHRVNIEYTTQLDDGGQHLVQAAGLEGADRLILIAALAAAIEDQKKSALGTSTPTGPVDFNSSTASSAEAPATEHVDQRTETLEQKENTPEQVSENKRIRDEVFSGMGEGGNPKFSDYPSPDIYSGPSAPLDRSSEEARTFKTRLADALTEGDIDFAGEYVSATWGCGTGCAYTTFVSKRSGQVIEQGLGGEYGPRVVKHLPSSQMLIAEGGDFDDDYNQTGYYAYFYELKDGRLALIKKVPIPEEIY